MLYSRRKFAGHALMFAASLSIMGCTTNKNSTQPSVEDQSEISAEAPFQISLAQWSLHQALFDKEITNLDFARVAREEYGIEGIEYVSAFFDGNSEDTSYLNQLNQLANQYNVRQLLIMIDNEGNMADADPNARDVAVKNHYKWVDAAKHLGCHSIRVNCFGEGTEEEVMAAGVDGLRKLSEYAKDKGINIIVENHGGYSSNGAWLSSVMEQVDMDNCGTLPDFGNFCIRRAGGHEWEGDCVEEYDRYKGVQELIAYAKGLSAKSYDFDEKGEETTVDFTRMLQIAKDAGYQGFVGIEYEGKNLSEHDGILATKALLLDAMTKLE